MPQMTDPMDAFRTLQPAIDSGEVQLQPCELSDDLKVIVDYPMGELRLTYVSMSYGQAVGIVQFVKADPFNSSPCFSIGCAVHESLRKQGLATRIVADALAELENGLRGTSLKRYYVEAVVSTSNEASNRIATRFISDAPTRITDEFSGEPALQYVRLFSGSG